MDGVVFIPIFFVIFFAVGVAILVGSIKAAKSNQQQADTSAESYREHASGSSSSSSSSTGKATMTEEQRRRLEYLREQQKKRETAAEKHERHLEDAEEHGHTGEEEHYEEIVGSLGDINDEGCEDLNGVRFIAHDLAYDGSDNERDYTELARAIVLGEIINNPRFKGVKRS